jgi:hypothetical protein
MHVAFLFLLSVFKQEWNLFNFLKDFNLKYFY